MTSVAKLNAFKLKEANNPQNFSKHSIDYTPTNIFLNFESNILTTSAEYKW